MSGIVGSCSSTKGGIMVFSLPATTGGDHVKSKGVFGRGYQVGGRALLGHISGHYFSNAPKRQR
jgi:hypothetical protein